MFTNIHAMTSFAFQTYSVNKQVPDAASSATAMFTGVKVNQRIIGLDINHNINDTSYCENANSESRLESLATWAQDAGKSTGMMHLKLMFRILKSFKVRYNIKLYLNTSI